ncbi:hypothetical protein CC80DRAFT_514107 [Byssothecium circinans]|uniref:Zn(2)-C6 fungal-type domain-containing protein n=1 Tax=Byssothecium circinans TaxID=147558 RepID=A0A6A5U6L0_9PLEO|nr:hypothetical protein CC80DRAFT_514107 [Byssothecium circinans]
MPPDRARSLNAQGRQKSCSECAKAKRKCDLQQPNCRRCTRQKLTCIYPPPNAPSTAAATSTSQAETPSSENSATSSGASSWLGVDATSLSATLDTEFLDFDINPLPSCYNVESIECGTIINMTNMNGPPIDEKAMSMLMMSPFADSRIGYSMKQWKKTPEMMVKENRTHWSHPKLYEDFMPRSLQDAYAACALAMARTETNATFIARHVTERAHELIEQDLPTSPVEILARAHALVLYQIILICGGDIRYYSQAEKLIPHLENIGATLIAITSHDEELTDPLPLYPSSAARDAWSTFIFRESSRRTLLITFQATSTCRLLLGHYSSCASHLALGNKFTVSSALWDAKSPFEFAMAWNDKKHFLVRELDFREMLKEADAKDVDVFTRMMLVGIMGIDDVRGWLHTRGGDL